MSSREGESICPKKARSSGPKTSLPAGFGFCFPPDAEKFHRVILEMPPMSEKNLTVGWRRYASPRVFSRLLDA